MLTASLLGCAGAPEPRPIVHNQMPVQVRAPVAVSQAKLPEDLKSPPEDIYDSGLSDKQAFEGYTRAIRRIPSRQRRCPTNEKVYPIELNLQSADLVEAIKVLADTLGMNYMIDPRVKGTANVRATGRLTRSELVSIMETLLTVNGAALVQEGQVTKIVPAKEAAAGGMPVWGRGAAPEGMTAQVIFLDQTPSKEMAGVLKPLMSPGGAVSEASGNALILLDYPANLDKLLKLINLIDTQALGKSLIQIVRINNADPTELVSELETIFNAYGSLTKKEQYGVNFVPVSRLNGLMVLAASQPLMNKALHWIRQLDSKSDAMANIHIHHVENYKARNLADIVTQAYGGTVAGGGGGLKEVKGTSQAGGAIMRMRSGSSRGGSQTGMMGAGAGTGTGAGGIGGREGLGSGGSLLGDRGRDEGKERAVPLSPTAGGETPKENVRIIPDEENNLLVIMAPPYEWRVIQNLLRRLDIMPRQVLNEVLIAEVRLTGELRYGIEWFFKGQVSQASTSGTGTTDSTTTAATTATFQPLGAVGGALTSSFSYIAVDAYNTLKALIQLLAQEGKVNILASPHIMAANNQEAYIQIGDEVPILSSQAIPLVSQQTSFATQTINYRSTGIILAVKPQINARGMVTLDIAQEVSSATPTLTGVSGTPTISVRQAKTTLVTADNQTIVLGGLIREDTTRERSGIPGLKDMPLLGPLFGRESKKTEKTELIVLITPHIINTLEDGARLTQKMKDAMTPEAFRPKLPGLPPTQQRLAPTIAPPTVPSAGYMPREVAPPVEQLGGSTPY